LEFLTLGWLERKRQSPLILHMAATDRSRQRPGESVKAGFLVPISSLVCPARVIPKFGDDVLQVAPTLLVKLIDEAMEPS